MIEKASLQPEGRGCRHCGIILFIRGTENEGMVIGKVLGRLAKLQNGRVGGSPPFLMTVLRTGRSTQKQVNGAITNLAGKG